MVQKSKMLSILAIALFLITLYPVPSVQSSDTLISQDWDSTVDIEGSQVHILKDEAAFDGYNMFMLRKTSQTTGERQFYLMIVDMDGNIILDKYMGAGYLLADCPAEFIDTDTILTRNNYGVILYSLHNDSITTLNFQGHHEFEYNPVSDTFFTFNYKFMDINGTSYLYDYLREYDRNGHMVWSLDTSTFIPVSHYCPYEDRYMNSADMVHSNTIFYNPDDDTILYNSRNTNTFYLIDHNTSEILWGLGEFGNFTLYDQYGNQKDNLFYHAHAIEPIDDNTFILFDNDLHNQTSDNNRISRMEEITVDWDDMSARISWVWQAPQEYFSFIWGDADILPNGNRLGVFGPWTHFDGGPYGARLVEVNPQGDIVWEMAFENNADFNYGVYRIERYRQSPITTQDSISYGLVGENISLDWDLFYNFRPKRNITGSYDLYIDDSFFGSGTINYDKYWRPAKLSLDIGVLDKGIHNATLVFDEIGGTTTTHTMYVNISLFYLELLGPLSFSPSSDHIIKWSGDSLVPLDCVISVDDVVEKDFAWNGTMITFDVSDYSAGNHSVLLELYNGSQKVFSQLDFFQIIENPFTIPIEAIILFAALTSGIVIVIAIVFKKRKGFTRV